MNTIGMGNGSGSSGNGSGGFAMQTKPIETIHREQSLTDVNSLTFTQNKMLAQHSDYWLYVGEPLVKYKDEYYGAISNGINTSTGMVLYKSTFQFEDDYLDSTESRSIISEYKLVGDIVSNGDSIYFYANPSTGTSYDGGANHGRIYRLNGTLTSDISGELGSLLSPFSTDADRVWRIDKFAFSPDDDTYFIMSNGTDNTSDKYYCPHHFLCKLSETTGFGVVGHFNNSSNRLRYENGFSSYINLFYNSVGSNDVSSTDHGIYPLSVEFPDENTIELYIGMFYIGQGTNTSGNGYYNKHILKWTWTFSENKNGINMYTAELTDVTSATIDSCNISYDNGWPISDRYWWTSYILSKQPDINILMMFLHRNVKQYEVDGRDPYYAYIINLERQNIQHKQIPQPAVASSYVEKTFYDVLFDLTGEKKFAYWTYKRYGDNDIYDRDAYEINVDGIFNTDSASYEITIPLFHGDTVSCGAGIINVTFNDEVTELSNATTYSITTDGTYTFKTNMYNTDQKPEFIVETKDGYLLNMDVTAVSTDITAYLGKGMKVNDVVIETPGFNEIPGALENGRVVITKG